VRASAARKARLSLDQLGAEPVDLAAVHRDFARDPGAHVAERIDRERLFLAERELCHATIFEGPGPQKRWFSGGCYIRANFWGLLSLPAISPH
jgi:hypothetical protein